MVEFIRKEAYEKAKEIELKANEEYEIEKANIVRSETSVIDAQYEKKYKQFALSQQISKSTIANEARLKVLAAKESVLNGLFEDASKRLGDISKDTGKYEKVLTGLIEEGLVALLEDKVVLKVREADVPIAEKSATAAAKYYEDQTGKKVEIVINKEDYLSKDSAGGVIIANASGKIDVNNTFEERLKLLSEGALPEIRLALFGPSATRKFFN